MRVCAALVILALLIGCSKNAADQRNLVGSWVVIEPVQMAMAFSSRGTFESQLLGQHDRATGHYSLSGDRLVLEYSGTDSVARQTYTVIWVDSDRLKLTLALQPGDLPVPAETLDARALRLRRSGPAEALDPDAVADATDTQSALTATAKTRSDSERCLSNVKQISLGLLMYSQDYDEVWTSSDWQANVTPYIRDVQVFNCPSVAKGGQQNGYAFNEQLVGAKSQSIANPASTPAVFDSQVIGPSALSGPQGMSRPARHQEGNSVAYADGHAEAVP